MGTQLTWHDAVDQCANDFKQIATRNNLVTWAEESLFAKQTIDKNPKLAGCTMATVQNSIVNVAAIGLTLNPALGYAYLVPESQKIDKQWVNQCTLKVSFKGLLKIANESGSILWAKAEIVKENDSFTYNGPCKMPDHKMDPFSSRGKTVGVYCIAKTCEGDYLSDIMSMEEIQQIKGAAKTSMVWDKWFDEMAKKAIIKRASKQWPRKDQGDRIDKAVAILNETEGSAEKDITPQANPEYTGRYYNLISEGDGVGMVMLIDDIKKDTNYSNESYDNYMRAIKGIHDTIPRGSKGNLKEKEKNLLEVGLLEISEVIGRAIDSQDENTIAEYWDVLGKSKAQVLRLLSLDDVEYLKSRAT